MLQCLHTSRHYTLTTDFALPQLHSCLFSHSIKLRGSPLSAVTVTLHYLPRRLASSVTCSKTPTTVTWSEPRGVPRLDRARSKKQVGCPHVRTYGLLKEMCCIKWTCDIVGTFRCPGHCAPLCYVLSKALKIWGHVIVTQWRPTAEHRKFSNLPLQAKERTWANWAAADAHRCVFR